MASKARQRRQRHCESDRAACERPVPPAEERDAGAAGVAALVGATMNVGAPRQARGREPAETAASALSVQSETPLTQPLPRKGEERVSGARADWNFLSSASGERIKVRGLLIRTATIRAW